MLISRRAFALLALTTSAACSAANNSAGTGGAGGGAAAPSAGSGNQAAAASVGSGATGATSPGGGGGTGAVGAANGTGAATALPTGGVGGGPGTGGSQPITGGASQSTGGAATGGAATGGVSTGGAATGGVSTGGVGGVDALRVMKNVCDSSGEATTPGYIVRSNKWNDSASGKICIDALGDPGRTYAGFDITDCSLSTNTDTPSAYPSIVAGWHYTLRTAGSGMPKTVSSASSIPVTWNYQAPSGKYNVSFDIWLHPQTDVDAPDGGMEFMIWVASAGGPNPAGSQVGNSSVAGGSWDIWQGNVSGWKYLAYKRTSNLASLEDLDILPILKDAVSKGYLDGNWNIIGIEAGFEIWNCSGSGAGTNYYSVKVN